MKIEIITDLAQEPVTLEQVKSMLRITGNGHDGALISMIVSARKYMEKALSKSLGVKTIRVTSGDELIADDLPYGPNQTIVTEAEINDDYVYTYTAGFEEVPEDIKQGIMYLVKHWYDIDDTSALVPDAVKNIIALNTELPML